MSAFERETDMRFVGMQAVRDAFGDDSTEVFEEFRFNETSMDALITRVDDDALDERRDRGLDEPLVGEARGVYEWFARETARNPENLLQNSPDAKQDRELIECLIETGFLEKRDGGTLSAVEFDRHIDLISVEFAASGWRQGSGHPFHSESFTDEQWLVIDADNADDAAEATKWFKANGFGLATLSPDGVLTTVVEPATDGPADEQQARALAEDVYAEEVR